MIIVSFESKKPIYSEVVAIFKNDELYNMTYESLENSAKKLGFDMVTENVTEGNFPEKIV